MLKGSLNRAFHADRVAGQCLRGGLPQAGTGGTVDGLPLCRARSPYLPCGEFNPDSRTLAIRLSKGKVRHVVLTDEAKATFETWTSGRASADLVFLREDGEAWGTSHQKRPLDEVRDFAPVREAIKELEGSR